MKSPLPLVQTRHASKLRADAAANVRQWTRESLRLPDTVDVWLTELACTEPGCPPFETVVALMAPGHPTRSFKLHRPLVVVTRADVETLRTKL